MNIHSGKIDDKIEVKRLAALKDCVSKLLVQRKLFNLTKLRDKFA